MKTTVSEQDFHAAFIQMGREGNFSSEGRTMLFEYIEECGAASGEEFELDVIGLCCEYAESSVEDIISDYDVDSDDDDDAKNAAVRKYLERNTTVIGETLAGFLYVEF